MHLGSLLTRHARYRPDHTALVCAGERLTFAELDRRVNRIAQVLRDAGLAKGDRVATLLPNGVELLGLYWACAKSGVVVVPMSPLLQAPALAGLLRDAGARGLVAAAVYRDNVDAVVAEVDGLDTQRTWLVGDDAPAPYPDFATACTAASDAPPADAGLGDDDVFNIVYSSGTTGQPKGIVHTHYVRAMYSTLFAQAWRMTPESVVLHSGSIVFNGAFVTEGVTHVMLVPSQIVALLEHPDASTETLGSLQMVMSLGAPLHLEHKQRLDALLPGRFHELYGLTEGFVTILDREDYPRKPGSVGVPPPFFEMRIVGDDGAELPPGEVGEICGRGPILMPGYHGRPDLTAEAIRDGWLHTGDLGHVDDDGFLYLVDRQKDLIISGGVNVYPRDIEEVAVQHLDVREAAVFGAPDPKWGETPVAAVVLREGATTGAHELRDWINTRVGAKFQRVSRVELLDDFPRNVAGKTLKRELRDRFATSGS
jgi:acyl-CoA synthetase (AMP-forming)/AMP-acid ligase II